jgi:hypothetical protein
LDTRIQVTFDIEYCSIAAPLTDDFTSANIPDNQLYPILVCNLPSETIKKTLCMAADLGYDDYKLYELSIDFGFQFVCPVQSYKNTSEERLQLIDFYKSALRQVAYSKRSTSIYPLVEHIKAIFRLDSLPVRGYDKIYSVILLSVLLYQIFVYCNCKIQKTVQG